MTGARALPYGKRVDRVIDYIRAHLADELYRGDPGVDAKRGIFRCDLCLPVRSS